VRLIPIVLALSGCASANHYSQWQGHRADDLITRWGAPARSATLSDGGSVLTYDLDLRAYPCRIDVRVDNGGTIRSVSPNPPDRAGVCFDAGVASVAPNP
jgi:hypothetical protein